MVTRVYKVLLKILIEIEQIHNFYRSRLQNHWWWDTKFKCSVKFMRSIMFLKEWLWHSKKICCKPWSIFFVGKMHPSVSLILLFASPKAFQNKGSPQLRWEPLKRNKKRRTTSTTTSGNSYRQLHREQGVWRRRLWSCVWGDVAGRSREVRYWRPLSTVFLIFQNKTIV